MNLNPSKDPKGPHVTEKPDYSTKTIEQIEVELGINKSATTSEEELPNKQIAPPLYKNKKLIIITAIAVFALFTGTVGAYWLNNDQTNNSGLSQVGNKPNDVEHTDGNEGSEAPQQNTPESSPDSPTQNGTSTNTTTTPQPSNSSNPPSTPSSPSPSPGSQPQNTTYDISYTNSCYSPANRTIKTGDTVRFVNNSNKDMWPASNSHPQHDIYSEFDAKKDIAPGSTYSFTFTKVGVWGYHDHNKPSCGGVITVTN